MPSFTFNHGFALLMAGCAACALFLPREGADRLRAPMVLLFAPVSEPVHRGSAWIGERLRDPPTRDQSVPTTPAELEAENAALRMQVAALAHQLEELKRLNKDREAMGLARDLSVPARVVGLDASASGGRQMMQVVVDGAWAGLVKDGQPVISARGLVGRVAGTWRGGTRVRLTTDLESRIVAKFVRFTRDDAGNLVMSDVSAEKPLVEGAGAAGMRVANLPMARVQAAGVREGDWLAVNDYDGWPYELQGFLIGRVARVAESRTRPLMAELTIEPPAELRKLREVMVVAKGHANAK